MMNMRTILDNETGMIIMIPDSEPDHRLLGHLINFSDLTEFSTYIACEQRQQKHTITVDLGVSVDRINQYMSQQAARKQNDTFTGNLIGFNRDSY